MLRLELSRKADTDLTGILEYGALQFGWERAEAYVRSLDDSFALIARNPHIGSIHPDIVQRTRSWPHGSHRIYYEANDETLTILAVLHKSMDVPRWIG